VAGLNLLWVLKIAKRYRRLLIMQKPRVRP
jgi:hypothetical protein